MDKLSDTETGPRAEGIIASRVSGKGWFIGQAERTRGQGDEPCHDVNC